MPIIVFDMNKSGNLLSDGEGKQVGTLVEVLGHRHTGGRFQHQTSKKNNSEPFVFEYDNDLFVDKIFYSHKNRQNFDTLYAKAKVKEAQIKEKDKKNMLYVALTRAEDGMIIIKKDKESRFDILGLEPMKLGELEVDQNSHVSVAKSHVITRPLSHYGIQESDPVQENTAGALDAVIFGDALHYGLEMLESFSTHYVEFAIQALYHKYGRLLGDEVMKNIERRISSLVSNEEFISLLNGASQYREQSLSFDNKIKQIDLLLEYEDRCIVVDYKSSPKEKDKHIKQVDEYCVAIEKS